MTPAQLMRIYAGVAGALAVLLVVEWLPAGDPAVAPLPAARHAARAEVGLEPKQTLAWADTINRRPLFTVSRKPAHTKAGLPVTADTGLPRLAGIMITRAGRRAIFMPEGGKPTTLAEGATLDDYTIRQIRADRVVLSGGPKGDIVLQPSYDTKQHTGGLILPTSTPGFPQPGFNPGFNPAFNPQPFQPAPFMPPPQPQPQPQPPADDNDADSQPATPPAPTIPPPFNGFRGPLPRGRE
jgi:hypothetical protein